MDADLVAGATGVREQVPGRLPVRHHERHGGDHLGLHGGANQQWALDGDGTVTNVYSGLCLALTNDATADGAPVELGTCDGDPSQQWVRDTGGGNGLAVGGSYSFATVANLPSCMDIEGDQSADLTQVEEYACNGGPSQVFTARAAGNGLVTLVQPQSGKCLDVFGAGTADQTNVNLYDCNGTVAQQFSVQTDANGYVTFQNPNSGKCIDVTGASPANKTKLEIYDCNGGANQKWQPWGGGLWGGASYSFETVLNGTSCLDVNADSSVEGTQVQEFTCNGLASQSFIVLPLWGGLVSLQNANGTCVNVNSGLTNDGAKIDVWDCNQSVAQQFMVQVDENQNVTFMNPNSGKCLDISGASTADLTVVDLYDCNGGDNQKWTPVLD